MGDSNVVWITREGFSFEACPVLGIGGSCNSFRNIQATMIVSNIFQALLLVIKDHEDITEG